METDAAPGDAHPEIYGGTVFRLIGFRDYISDQNGGGQLFQDIVYSGRSGCAVFSGDHVGLKNDGAVFQIPHMLGSQIHFHECAAPVLGGMGGSGLITGRGFCHDLAVSDAAYQSGKFRLFIDDPAVGTAGNLRGFTGRGGERPGSAYGVVTSAKFGHPVSDRGLVQCDVKICVIGQPGGDQCLIYHDGNVHFVGDACLAVLVQSLAEFFQLRRFRGVFRGFVKALFLEINLFIQPGNGLMDLL